MARTPQVVINDADIFEAHEGGKLSVELKSPLDTQRALSIAYTPGVAQVSRAIASDHTLAAKYTWANRLVAVISDGTAVLGLGDIGPAASLPVMEGKSALFKAFGGLDSIPIVLDTKDPDEIVETIIRLRPTFGAVNLEDISAPRCFEVERRLIEALDCPVMHDDQHGTAIVVLAALLGATKVLERDMHTLKLVIAGAGAAGVACANILLAAGVKDIVVLDSQGIVHSGRDGMNSFKVELAGRTNPRGLTGGIAEALNGADVFMGLSAGLVPEELIATMTPGGIVFAMSNPDPEIHPDAARLELMESGRTPMNAIAYRLYARRMATAIDGYPPALLAAQLGRMHPAVLHAIEQRRFEVDGVLGGRGAETSKRAACALLRQLSGRRPGRAGR